MENDAAIGWIAAIIIGGLAGWFAEMFMKSNMGVLMNIVLGIVGAIVANAILSVFGIVLGGWIGYLIAGFVGACILDRHRPYVQAGSYSARIATTVSTDSVRTMCGRLDTSRFSGWRSAIRRQAPTSRNRATHHESYVRKAFAIASIAPIAEATAIN